MISPIAYAFDRQRIVVADEESVTTAMIVATLRRDGHCVALDRGALSAPYAALSECHLLSYLHACVTAGVVVVAYEDDATGLMAEDGRGGGAFQEVVLRPHVTIADASMMDAATTAHEQAHEWCFIANSVNFAVRHEPVIEVAGD